MSEDTSFDDKRGLLSEDNGVDLSDIPLLVLPHDGKDAAPPFQSFSVLTTRSQSRKSHKRSRDDEWHADHRDLSSLENPAWEKYYRGNIVPEEDWNSFACAMKKSLPMAIRVNTANHYSKAAEELAVWLRVNLSSVFDVANISFFLPEGYAFQCGVSRGTLKRDTVFKKWKQVISALNEGGYITRQETVSMLPPLLLQVQAGQRVLDLCAAPGSKTSQILEKLASGVPPPTGGEKKKEANDGTESGGILVANDVSVSRLDILHHQTNRSAGAHAHLIITNYDAACFPLLPAEERFHRVLCDVMCSGDGTLRKSLDLWPRWSVLLGPSLHASQCRVLRRGMKLCQENGILVYSTCSLNPVEDEAVISTCLRDIEGDGGRFELLDPSPILREWQYSPGLTEWTLWCEDEKTPLRTFEDAEKDMKRREQAQKDKNSSTVKKRKKIFRFLPSMFSNTTRLKEQRIERCCRVLPHQQDTGGFFVAAMRCVKCVPWEAKEKGSECVAQMSLEPSPLQPPTEALRDAVVNALQLPSSFPLDRLLARNETKREQKLYYAHPPTIAFSHRLGKKVVSVGCKVFEAVFKYSWDKFRFSNEGVSSLLSLLPQSFVHPVTPNVIVKLAEKNGTMSETEFLFLVGKDQTWLCIQPPSFLLHCDLPQLFPPSIINEGDFKAVKEGVIQKTEMKTSTRIVEQSIPFSGGVTLMPITIGIEKVPSSSQIKTKVALWQEALCRLTSLDHP